MEFRFRAGEERDPPPLPRFSPSLPDGFIAPQSLSAGFIRDIGGEIGRVSYLMHHPMSALGAMRRELQKERIREEIIAREIADQRILEEEVRRELEAERAMRFRRPPLIEHLMLTPPPPEDTLLPGPVAHRLEVGVGEDLPLQVNPQAEVGKKLALFEHDNDLETEEPSPVAEVKSVEEKVSGMKRKGAAIAVAGSSKVGRASQQSWSCALCQVSATCEEGLQNHLQGKKHKVMVARLSGKDTGARNSGALPEAVAISVQDVPTHGPRKVSMKVDGKMHEVIKKEGYLWCEPCKVKCNSTMMMVAHLSGKKHTAWMMGKSRNDCKPTAADVVKEERDVHESGTVREEAGEETNGSG